MSTLLPISRLDRLRRIVKRKAIESAGEAWINTVRAPLRYRLARAWELVPGALTLGALGWIALVTAAALHAAGLIP